MSFSSTSNYAFCLGIVSFFIAGNIISSAFILRDQRTIGEQWLRPVYSEEPSSMVHQQLFPAGRHQSKRMAEMNKRERIIMDALGGNDFLIKRSNDADQKRK